MHLPLDSVTECIIEASDTEPIAQHAVLMYLSIRRFVSVIAELSSTLPVVTYAFALLSVAIASTSFVTASET
ncbi:hypothetical protein ANAPRD1_01137 [Anaplasma phagocytophilum]|uniref:hypothetical protein n=1 Tax=Anaplasma phagocytophilum TaxID=948 RepID=UPI0007DF68A2|nr:hypothetical protein [Anaplasma phagocytophilum]SCV66562.1 hypothetical protein ANAPRD1_01137 [Anaplasma phagocytophilum]